MCGKGPQELKDRSPGMSPKSQHIKAWERHVGMVKKKDLSISEHSTDSDCKDDIEDD